MTANGDSEPRAPRVVKIRPSIYMFGNYEVKVVEAGEITNEYMNLMLKLKGDSQDINLSLSFKHIVRVDFLDNKENEGAGLIVYVNDFMAKKIEEALRFELSNFRNFHNSYAQHAFVLLDVLNSDPQTMADIRSVLDQAANFHHEYTTERFKQQAHRFKPESPTRYISPMTSAYFKKILLTLHKELYIEELTVKGQKYVSGRIVNIEPNTKCAIQQDGRIVQLNSELMGSGRNRPLVDQRARTFAMKRLPMPADPGAQQAKNARLAPSVRPLTSEVHTIDDDAAAELAAVIPHKLIAAYQPTENFSCKIYDQDLCTLNATEMLNDTIIEFYMNYILYNIIDSAKRNRVHIFSTYFFSKLSKDVYGRTPKVRAKKISDNYLTLKSWTKTVDVFDKDFLVVPINEDAHWYLAIIAYPNLGIISKPADGMTIPQDDATTSPPPPSGGQPAIPIFIFDSLLDGNDTKKHRMVADLLLDYLVLEYQDKRSDHDLPGVAYRRNQFRLIIPQNMPQQSNYYDCGIFMLQFAESFLGRLPVLDEITDPIVYDNFFGNVDLSEKRENIQKLIREMGSAAERN